MSRNEYKFGILIDNVICVRETGTLSDGQQGGNCTLVPHSDEEGPW